MSTRERFEAWAVKPERSLSIDRHPDYPDAYLFWMTEQSWAAYKAARAEALEEAADACEELSVTREAAGNSTEASACWDCAASIRALKEEPA